MLDPPPVRRTAHRYPMFIAETGCEGDARGPWLNSVLAEVADARDRSVDLLGVSPYPILDHPGWNDDRTCPNGLLCGFSEPERPIHAPLAVVIRDYNERSRPRMDVAA